MKRVILNTIFSIMAILLASCGGGGGGGSTSTPAPIIANPTNELTARLTSSVLQGTTTEERTATVSFVWSEAVTGFSADCFVVSNGEISNFIGSGTEYSLTLSALADGIVSLEVPVGTVACATGRKNNTVIYNFRYEKPTIDLEITSSEGTLTNSSSMPVTFTFSREVDSFEVTDIALTGDVSITDFSGSDKVYIATLLFSDDSTASITVSQDAAHLLGDALVGTQGSSYTLTYDSTSPTVEISGGVSNGGETGNETTSWSVKFSEAVTGFTQSDLVITNGTVSNFAGSGDTYTFDATAAADGDITFDIDGDVANDSAGNGNSGLSSQYSYSYDSSQIAATIEFTSGSGITSPTSSSTIPVTIEFGEEINGSNSFTSSDITLSSGTTLSNFSGSGDTYTFDLTPAYGEVTVSIAAGAANNSSGNNTGEASFTFLYDNVAPAAVDFSAIANTSGTTIASGSSVSDIIKIVLNTDYSTDTGSTLTYEYTTDGSTWSTYTNPSYVSSDGTYTINIRVKDAVGHVTTGTEPNSVVIDTEDPDAPIVNILTDPVNGSNYKAFSFKITGGEANSSYSYKVISTGGSAELTGTGTLNGSGKDTITAMDLSTISDGTLTVQVKQTDKAGNDSGIGQDSVVKDTEVGDTLVVEIKAPDTITSQDNSDGSGGATSNGVDDNKEFAFVVSNGENGSTYEYTVQSSGGGPKINGTGTFDATGQFAVTGLNIAAMADGVLTVSAKQTDAVGNESAIGSDTVTLDAVAQVSLSFSAPENLADFSFSFQAEGGATYIYEIRSSEPYKTNGGPVSGNGTVAGTGGSVLETVGPINLDNDMNSGGYLILLLTVTDTSNNISQTVQVVDNDTTPVLTSAANFSTAGADHLDATAAVYFDLSYHKFQSIPADVERVKYDTDTAIGTEWDDTFLFSALEAGETFTIDGGAGTNTIDLSNYNGTDITIHSGDVTDSTVQNDGTITISVGGGIATINFTDCHQFQFNSNIFDGTPHALKLQTDYSHEWIYTGSTREIICKMNTEDNFVPALVRFNGTLSSDYTLDIALTMFNSGFWKNGSIVFDYIDPDNFKTVEAGAGGDEWRIIEHTNGNERVRKYLRETLDVGVEYNLQLSVEGEKAKLVSGGVVKKSYNFAESLNDGEIGVMSRKAHSAIKLNMGPSNWAPYAKSYNKMVSQTVGQPVTLNLLGDANDNESETITLVSLTSTEAESDEKGTMVDNGDGTITYTMPSGLSDLGKDTYTYVITDGTNTTEGTIIFDVVP